MFLVIVVDFFQQVIIFHSIASNFIFNSQRQCLYSQKILDCCNYENLYPRNTTLWLHQPIQAKFSTREDLYL